jgi:hypothetical protein
MWLGTIQKEGVLEIEKKFRQKFLGKIRRTCRYLLIENHIFHLDKL